jgi:regulatory protein
MRQRRRGSEPADGPAEDRDLGPDAGPEAVAREIVLRKLTGQARSRGELAKALAQRHVPQQTAAEVLDRFEEVGLVDDAAFAESWVRSRQSRRHLSKRVLRQELLRKGVDRDEIDNALEQIDPDDEYAAARDLATKKFRSITGLDRVVAYRRLAGALGRRGFGSGTISRVLAEVLDNTPVDDTPDVSIPFDS